MATKPSTRLFLSDVPNDHLAILGARGNFIARNGDIEDAYSAHMVLASGCFLFLFNVNDTNPTSFLSHNQAFSPLHT